MVRDVEGRLVARAEQMVSLVLVQRNRAPDVGADLRIGDDSVDTPRFAVRVGVQLTRVDAHEQHGCLRLLIEWVSGLAEVLRDDVEGGADRDV